MPLFSPMRFFRSTSSSPMPSSSDLVRGLVDRERDVDVPGARLDADHVYDVVHLEVHPDRAVPASRDLLHEEKRPLAAHNDLDRPYARGTAEDRARADISR